MSLYVVYFDQLSGAAKYFFQPFLTYFVNFKPFSVISQQNRLKTAENSISTCFWARTAHKSWSKYATIILIKSAQ